MEEQLGITIYYSGAVAELEPLKQSAMAIARERSWEFRSIPNPGRGFVIYTHPDCEPLAFNFDKRGKVNSWVKTQFAGAEVHVQIVDLLARIKPFFKRLNVEDDTGFTENGDRSNLEWHINQINSMIDEARAANPAIQTKVHLPSGLIVDILE